MSIEHPLIHNLDELKIEELQTRINDLNKKLAWAARSGNNGLRTQIQLVLNSYTEKYRQRQQELYDSIRKSGSDHSDKIDIS